MRGCAGDQGHLHQRYRGERRNIGLFVGLNVEVLLGRVVQIESGHKHYKHEVALGAGRESRELWMDLLLGGYGGEYYLFLSCFEAFTGKEDYEDD